MEPKAPAGYQVLNEGKARILYKEQRMDVDEHNMIRAPGKGKRKANEQNEVRGAVFYNPVQEFNRDISILTIRQFAEMRRQEL